MQIRLSRLAALLGAASLAACGDPLSVSNKNVVDVTTAQQSAAGIEQIVSKSFQAVFTGQFSDGDGIWLQTINSSHESSSSLGNFGMGLRNGVPRVGIDNSRANATAAGNNQRLLHADAYCASERERAAFPGQYPGRFGAKRGPYPRVRVLRARVRDGAHGGHLRFDCHSDARAHA